MHNTLWINWYSLNIIWINWPPYRVATATDLLWCNLIHSLVNIVLSKTYQVSVLVSSRLLVPTIFLKVTLTERSFRIRFENYCSSTFQFTNFGEFFGQALCPTSKGAKWMLILDRWGTLWSFVQNLLWWRFSWDHIVAGHLMLSAASVQLAFSKWSCMAISILVVSIR